MVLCLIIVNVMIHMVHNVSEEEIFQRLFVLLMDFCCAVFMFLLFLSFSVFDELSYLLVIIIATISFVNLCVVNRKYLKKTQYVFVFITLSIVYIIGITVLFGELYYVVPIRNFVSYDENLETIAAYIERLNEHTAILEEYTAYIERAKEIKLFPFPEEYRTVFAYFFAGFEKLFVPPDPMSLSNPHFLQHLIYLVINGTIISIIFDLIKSIISPVKKQ